MTLSTRIAALTGPDRAIDIDIGAAIYPSGVNWIECPQFTLSIDTANTLMPDGWQIASIERNWEGDWEVVMVDEHEDLHHMAIAKTECLARCAAALKARGL
jgi:tRNA/tmRNA/rRNA uracil-C5-methylase (TrmA/RlmC/RlmD family)